LCGNEILFGFVVHAGVWLVRVVLAVFECKLLCLLRLLCRRIRSTNIEI
jgi:hypothetical protein